MFAIAVSMLYNLFEWRDSDSLFSSLTFAMIANDAHSSHGIVLLLVLKVRKLVLFQFGGALST
jgi:cytochrome b561